MSEQSAAGLNEDVASPLAPSAAPTGSTTLSPLAHSDLSSLGQIAPAAPSPAPAESEEIQPLTVEERWDFSVHVDDSDCVMHAIAACSGGTSDTHPRESIFRSAPINRLTPVVSFGRSVGAAAGAWDLCTFAVHQRVRCAVWCCRGS